jgi:hypothetical protein
MIKRLLTVPIVVVVAVIQLFAFTAQADENYFGYTYGSEILPKGHAEIYQWMTARTGKGQGSYRALDLQTEFEYGFADRIQGSFYLNASNHNIAGVTEFTDHSRFRWNGLQASVKYSAMSPYKDGVGLAFYLEPGYKRYNQNSGDRTDTFFLEPKIIVEKHFLDDTVVWATNFSGEFEREHNLEKTAWESELELQASTGLSYRFVQNWYAGIEALGTSSFEHMHLDALGEYAIFAGPNLHYANRRWWATLTVFPQLTGWPETKGGRDLAHFEKLQVRLKIGVNL